MSLVETMLRYKHVLFLIFFITCGTIHFIVGICMISTYEYEQVMEHSVDYTNITNCGPKFVPLTCPEYMKKHNTTSCTCFMHFSVKNQLEYPVKMYYELESFDQQTEAKSRDDDQLAGNFKPIPSEACGNYRYSNVDGKQIPILPCGYVADSYFNDTYDINIELKDDIIKLNLVETGVISVEDEKSYRNPPDFSNAVQNFAKPLSWSSSMWESFVNGSYNEMGTNTGKVGFENERFIGWMHTDWKHKPYAFVNETDGLPIGNYQLRVTYTYPLSRYNGTRKIVFKSTKIILDQSRLNYGVACTAIGLLIIGGAIALYLYKVHKKKDKTNVREQAKLAG